MKKITKISTIVSSLVLVSLLAGFAEKPKEEKPTAVSKTTATETAPKIEVVTNENAKEIKVKEKAIDKAQSKSYYYDYNIKS